MECKTAIEAVSPSNTSSQPPYRVKWADRSRFASTVQASIGLKVAMALLAITWTFLLTAVGFGFGLFWSFTSCYDNSCSEADGAVIWLVPVIGFTLLGLVMSMGLLWKRAWFYAHPMVVWLPAIAMGGVIILGALGSI